MTFYAVPEETEQQTHLPLRITPSAIEGDVEFAATVGRVIELGDRLPLSGQPDMAHLGNAVHGFLAADCPESDQALRAERARDALDRWSVEALRPEDLLLASDRLQQHLASAFPEARPHKEVPIHGRFGLQRASGRIDLLLEAETEMVLIDHKTFPGAHDTWVSKALSFAPQLDMYRALIEQAVDKPVSSCWSHMPIIGRLIEMCIVDKDERDLGS